jgi:hypothetical protein
MKSERREEGKRRISTLLLPGLFFIAVFVTVPLAVVWQGVISTTPSASTEPSSPPAIPLQSDNIYPPDMSCSESELFAAECFFNGEFSVECGQEALEVGDWSAAFGVFGRLPESCDKYFGLYLAWIMDLYHYRNNRYLYNDETHGPIHNAGTATELQTHIAYLNQAVNVDKEIRANLALIHENECEFTKAAGEGELKVRYAIGPCWGRLADGHLVGDWDYTDAFFLYANLVPPTPPHKPAVCVGPPGL